MMSNYVMSVTKLRGRKTSVIGLSFIARYDSADRMCFEVSDATYVAYDDELEP